MCRLVFVLACVALTGYGGRVRVPSKHLKDGVREQLQSQPRELLEVRRWLAASLLASPRPAAAWQLPGRGWVERGIPGSQLKGSSVNRLNFDRGRLALQNEVAEVAASAAVDGHHGQRVGLRPAPLMSTRTSSDSLDELLAGPVPKLIDELSSSNSRLALSSSSAAKCLDKVCTYADMADASQDELAIQDDLLRTYSALHRRGVFRGFGSCVDSLPALPREVSPEEQERLTGLSKSAFEPSEEINLASIVGITDRKNVIRHEAGHLLTAYLMGNPIQSCVLDGKSAKKNSQFGIQQAGTVFFDPQFGKGMSSGEIRGKDIDRYSIVVTAGIAAEAMVNGNAEGGAADTAALLQLFTLMQTGWDQARIQNQIRWGTTQAFLLLREHKDAYNAVVEALEKKASMGSAITALESALPTELPAEERERRKEEEAAGLAERRTRQAEEKVNALQKKGERMAAVMDRLAQIDQRLLEIDSELRR
mmetsp:Transcript_90414/g.156204  ORF Transcript_90414/g.156204 Transcript_90414/m.156204 type:complete len:478 (+) Transcript_90414:59-1492(+)